MSPWSILWWPAGVFAAYVTICFVVGFVAELLKGLGIRRKPKFRVIRCNEEES